MTGLSEQASAAILLPGGGGLGAMMRDHDWSRSPLGPPSGWPQSLRSVVGLLLSSKFPMFVAWGPELGFLYNDAYAEILGAKHPDALGRPFEQVWSEIWSDIAPLVETALRGEASWLEDLLLLVDRKGFEETAWFTFSYSPVRDEGGDVAGMFCAVTETTGKVLAQRRLSAEAERQAFLVQLGDTLRDLTAPSAILTAAAGSLARHLGGARAGYSELEPDGVHVSVDHDWCADGVQSVVGRHDLSDYGTPILEAYRSGLPLVVDDFATDERSSAATVEAHASIGVRAQVVAPLVKGGRLTALLWVHATHPRKWSDEEVALVEDVAQRTWAALERAGAQAEHRRADAARRSGEERLLFALDAGGLGAWEFDLRTSELTTSPHCRSTYGWDPDEQFTYEDLRQVIHPDDRERQAMSAATAAKGQGDYNVEYRVVWPDGQIRWLAVRGRTTCDDDGVPHRMAGVSIDITHRMMADLHQRLLIDELNHRVKNTLATIQSIAMQTFRAEEGEAGAPPEQRKLFESRLIALSKVHDVLTRENWEGAKLRDVVLEAVAAHCGGDQNAFTVQGPDPRLAPRMALSLSMALHELCTNAAKYGALSVPTGRVSIRWQVEDGISRRLNLRWEEQGGPLVSAPTRKGFGSRLIERQLARELRGSVMLDYAPRGVVCTIDVPLADLPQTPAQILALAAVQEG